MSLPFRVLVATLLALMIPAGLPGSASAANSNADYLAFADRMVQRLDDTWSERDGRYHSSAGGLDSRFNAAMLLIHATAAAAGHEGPARNDERARLIAGALTRSPPFFTGFRQSGDDSMFHSPAWLGGMTGTHRLMDKAIDPKVAEGLQMAWRARGAIGLPQETADRIVSEISQVAHGPFFRYPQVRLNQINWPAELYAYSALVTGNPDLLRADYREQVRRFVAGIRRPWLGSRRFSTTNLSRTYRFQYQINQPPSSRRNLDSAEYANMTLHFLYFYALARASGMAPLPGRDVALLRGWVQRALFGYWMHSGFMNWDTGLGFKRWMRIKTWAYAQQGLITIASASRFQNDRRYGPWAKTLFDRGLRFYERQAGSRAGLFGVDMANRDKADARMTAARMGANAARAITAGLGRMPGSVPPPFYAFDPDVGRLVVSTPSYGTAVVPVNRGAFPYGGIELARLHGPEGDPIGGIGARPPAAFGVVVRDARGHQVLTTQTGLRAPHGAPLRVRRLPGGHRVAATGLPKHPPAGPFRVLEATGRRTRGGVVATTVHRFTRRSIVESWKIARRSTRRRYTVAVHFPAWGARADIDAVLDDGTTVALASRGQPAGTALMARVRRLEVGSPAGGYTVEPIGPAVGRAHVIKTKPQRSAPFHGTTLEILLRTHSRFRSASLRARIVPQPGG